jgi:streptogramin lyase
VLIRIIITIVSIITVGVVVTGTVVIIKQRQGTDNGNTRGNGTTVVHSQFPTGTIAEYPLPASDCCPDRITTGPDCNLWFTEIYNNSNKIGRIAP